MRKWSDFIKEGHISADFAKERPIIAIYGNFQIGKSTFLNCLLGHYWALAGKGRSTTALTTRYRYNSEMKLKYRSKQGELYPVTLEEIRESSFVEKVNIESGFHIESWADSSFLEICDKLIYPCNFLFYWSQMPEFELSKKDIDRPDTVIKHIKGLLEEEGYKTDADTIKELSSIPMLMEALKERITNYNPITHEWR